MSRKSRARMMHGTAFRRLGDAPARPGRLPQWQGGASAPLPGTGVVLTGHQRKVLAGLAGGQGAGWPAHTLTRLAWLRLAAPDPEREGCWQVTPAGAATAASLALGRGLHTFRAPDR